MTRDLPEWQPFDSAGSGAPALPPADGPPPVVAVVAAPGAEAEGWAAGAVKALAHRWAEERRRLFLADLGIHRPLLHEAVGGRNDEGVSDAFLYGASIQRIAQRVAGSRFFFAPAGTAVADVEAVMESPRWGPLVDGFRRAGAVLVLFLPADTPGLAAVLGRSSHVVLLAGPDEGFTDLVAGTDGRVMAILGPGGAAGREGEGGVSPGAVATDDEGSGTSFVLEDAPAYGELGGPTPAGSGPVEGAAPTAAVEPGATSPTGDPDDAPGAGDTAIAEDTPTFEDTAASEDPPAFEETATLEDTPTFEDTPAFEDTAAFEDTPTPEDAPALEDRPSLQDPSASEDTPAPGDATGWEAGLGDSWGMVPESALDAVPDGEAVGPPGELLGDERLAMEPDAGGDDLGYGASGPDAASPDEPRDEVAEEPTHRVAWDEQVADASAHEVAWEEPGPPAASEPPEPADAEPPAPAGEPLSPEGGAETPPAGAAPLGATADAGDFGSLDGLVLEEAATGDDAPHAGRAGGEEPSGAVPPAGTGSDAAEPAAAAPEADVPPDEIEDEFDRLFDQGAIPEPPSLPDDFGDFEPVPAAPPPAPGVAPPPGEPEALTPRRDPPEAAPRGGRSRWTLWALLLLLVLAGAAAALSYGLVEAPPFLAPWLERVPGLTSAPEAGADLALAPPPVPAARREPGEGTGLHLAWSLALGAFPDPPVARLQAESLSEQRPELLFVVAPVEVDGQVFHRLLVGPAADSATAVELRDVLAGTLTREDPASWMVRATPLAFRLAETDALDAATERAEELDEVELPTYVLEMPTPDGVRYRVYAGAYADSAEAAHLAGLLAQRGIDDAPLLRRMGRPPRSAP